MAERRITGRELQRRRREAWESSPYCASCGCVVAYPGGFELDHIIPLHQGGEDTAANCQILCVRWEGRRKLGCHAEKSAGRGR